MKLQFIHQVTRQTFPRSIETPCEASNFDQPIALNTDDDESHRLLPYPIQSPNHVKTFTPDEVEQRSTHATFTAQQLDI